MTTLFFIPRRLTGKEQQLMAALGQEDNLIVPVVYDGDLNAVGVAVRLKEQCEQLASYSPGMQVSLIIVGDSELRPNDAWHIKNSLAHLGIYFAGLVCTRADITLVCVLAANGHITWLQHATIDESHLVSQWREMHPEVIL